MIVILCTYTKADLETAFFRKIMKISKIPVGIAVFVILSASFARQVSDFARTCFGEKGFLGLVGSVFIVWILMFLVYAIRNKCRWIRIALAVAIVIAGVGLAWQIKIPEEKIHILEYAFLGFFTSRDLIKKSRGHKAIVTLVFCFAVGILDEIFQAVLPYRYFDWRDIAFNGLGGLWGMILFYLSRGRA